MTDAQSDQAIETKHKTHYDRRIVLALRRIMHAMDLHSRRLIKKYDVTVPQVVCLYEIYEKGAMTLALMSRTVHLSASTLVGIIDRLEEKGLVQRTRGLEDRRAIFIDITEKGRQFVRTEPHLLHNRLHGSLQTLAENDQILIANSLDMLVHLLEES